MIKIEHILITILLSFSVVSSQANSKPDSLRSFNSFKLFRLQNQWLSTGNISGMIYNKEDKISEVIVGSEFLDGDFHLTRDASQKHSYYLSTQSYRTIKDIHFYGNFSYQYSDAEGILWNGVFDPYRGNPYIIGDSVPGANYHAETYSLIGGVSKKMNEKLSLGILVDYFVGVGAKQKDPRPENIVMNFSINPSMILQYTNSKVGIDLGYRNRKEEIGYTQIATDNPDPTFFTFKGFGFFNSEVDYGVSRFQTAKNYFGGIQYEKKIAGLQSLTELRADYGLEITEDGSSTIKKEDGGDWETLLIELNQQLSDYTSNSIRKVTFNGSYFNGDGVEYSQEIVFDDDNHAQYITIGKNLKFNRQIIFAQLKFDYLRLWSENQINWESSAFVNFKMNNETYHYIPEIFTADYSNIEAGFNFEKNYYLNSVHFTPAVKMKYRYSLSNELLLSNDPTVTKKQNKEIFAHDFEYFSDDLINASASIKIGFDNQLIKNTGQLYLTIGYEYWQAIKAKDTKGLLTGRIGWVF